MEKIASHLFTESVRHHLRDSIIKNKGNEVFFTGTIDEESKKVIEVEAVVFGNSWMAPVFLEKALFSDVVIHNHPSGNLEPSEADLNIANSLMNHGGVSFLIVDNEVERVKIVYYAPDITKKERVLLEKEEILTLFAENGKIKDAFPSFEIRQPQLLMIEKLIETFNENYVALIEAGTGTGKSMAYLIPAIFWAIKNKEKIIVSTFTKNLQHQLYDKDLPLLQKILGNNFSYGIIKGKNNYVCLKKLEEQLINLKNIAETGLFTEEDKNRIEIYQAIQEWAENTQEGDLEELPFELLKGTGEELRASTDLCLHRRCPFFDRCFVFKNKQKVFSSDIIVVNHHYLLAQLSLEYEQIPTRILPQFSKIIIDEAHNFKKAAYSYLEEEASFLGILKLLNRIFNQNKKAKSGDLNLLFYALQKEEKPKAVKICQLIEEEIIPLYQALRNQIYAFFEPVYHSAEKLIPEKENQLRLKQTPLKEWKPYYDDYQALVQSVRIFQAQILRIVGFCRELPENLRLNYELTIRALERNAEKLLSEIMLFELLFSAIPEETAVWIALNKNLRNIAMHRLELDKTDFFEKTLYKEEYSILFTSATLAIGNSFQQFKEELGLTKNYSKKSLENIYHSPFNYHKQMRFFIPSDMPSPQGSDYADSHFIQSALEFSKNLIFASQGGVFVLCTSFWQIRELKNYLLKNNCPYPLFIHGEESRQALLSQFKSLKNAVLLGTDSFWEGVDIPGDALRLVIIFKLPFRPPTDPVTETLYEIAEKKGENPFMKIALPEAVIKFKQGFGRLIRTKTDKGCVVVLDKRIVEKYYGKTFLESLPIDKKYIGFLNKNAICFEVERFLEK